MNRIEELEKKTNRKVTFAILCSYCAKPINQFTIYSN